MKLDLDVLDALRDEPSLIIAPNHPALLDAVLMMSRLPRAVCIMKAQLGENAFLGGAVRLAGYIRNDSAVKMIRRASTTVRDGGQLLIFPEGTRTARQPVNPFKGGFALIAKTARVPVQTVFIATNSPFLSKGWPLFKKPDFPLIYRARLGRRFEVDGEVKTFVADMERYYRKALKPQDASRTACYLTSRSSAA
ncbi:MAG: lysophospholipid acyltransferase family protein [Betaproteobacteria bacterium]